MQLYMTYDNTTVNFQTSGRAVLDGFHPEVAGEDEETITDTFDIWIQATTAAALETSIRDINRAFEHAREHFYDYRACRLYFAMSNTESAWRARIKDGMVSLDERMHLRWKQNRVRATVTVEREAVWQGPETVVPLTNTNGTDVEDGLPIFSCEDGIGVSPAIRTNWVEIDSGVIEGDAPADARIIIENDLAASLMGKIWIGHRIGNRTNLLQVAEAEYAEGPTPVVDTDYSNEGYASVSIPTGVETELARWPLTANNMIAARGDFVHVLLRVAESITGLSQLSFRVKLDWTDVTLWQSEQVEYPAGMHTADLFTFRMPPFMPGITALDTLDLVLTAEHNTGSAFDLDFDFLAMVPAESWRELEVNYVGVAYGTRVVDDGIDNVLYRDAGDGTGRVSILTGYGEPIRLASGSRQQWLYFWLHPYGTPNPVTATTETAKISIVCRPRRRAL